MKGYVYVFHQLGTTYYKIGYTTKESVKDRFISFKMYAPNGGEIISVIESENPSRLEKEMHLKFSDKRLNGEFFSLNENDIHILKSFQDKRTRDIIDFVLTEIIPTEISIEQFKQIISKNIFVFKEIKNKENITIIDYLKENFKGEKLTSTEISLLIKTNLGLEYNSKRIGMALKPIFNQYITSIEGKSMRLYNIE